MWRAPAAVGGWKWGRDFTSFWFETRSSSDCVPLFYSWRWGCWNSRVPSRSVGSFYMPLIQCMTVNEKHKGISQRWFCVFCPLLISYWSLLSWTFSITLPLGITHLELISGIWELQASQLSPLPEDNRFLQENPVFHDLNNEEPDSSSSSEDDTDSNNSADSDSDDSNCGAARTIIPRMNEIFNADVKCKTLFPGESQLGSHRINVLKTIL